MSPSRGLDFAPPPSTAMDDCSLEKGPDDLDLTLPFSPVYHSVKQMFHRAAQVRIVGRTAERAVIEKFWQSGVVQKPQECAEYQQDEPKVLYICGNPGTGKTALVEEMLPELMLPSPRVNLIKVNCMMQEDPREILKVISKQMRIKGRPRRGRGTDNWCDVCEQLEASFSAASNHTVLVLDEIDQVAVKDSTLLQRIFTWPYAEHAKVSIIGIANALDLSIKYFSMSPSQIAVLNFSPYSAEDISRILVARLELANALASKSQGGSDASDALLIGPAAIEMCARKASIVGDLRKALEIMREAITLAQKQAAATLQLVKVDIKFVAQALDRIFGTTVRTSSRHAQLIQELNLHQKLLLAILHRLLRDSPTLRPTIQSLFDIYSVAVKTHRIVDGVTRSEFNDLIVNAESMGIFGLFAPGKRSKSTLGMVSADSKVGLCIPLEDIAGGLSDNALIRQLL